VLGVGRAYVHRLVIGNSRQKLQSGPDGLPAVQVASAPVPSEFLFTSESVTGGHPDKVADQADEPITAPLERDRGFRLLLQIGHF